MALLSKGLCAWYVNVLFVCFSNNTHYFQYAGKVTEGFKPSRGIKQGGKSSGGFFAIGIDALLYSNSWLHVESVLKGGAYWNDALSRQMYQSNTAGSTEVSAYDTPSPAAFVGELGFTGVLPLTSCLDFRFGYLVFWLQGIAQPTRQLSLPVSTTGDPLVLQDGGTVVQGLTLGLEGRW